MRGGKFLHQLEHVIVLPTDDPVAPHLGGITRGETHGDGIVMHVQPDVEGGAGRKGDDPRPRALLRLDSFWVAEYVALHGVCSFGHPGCLGRKSHNLWLGVPLHGSQPTLIPESKHRFHSQQKPY